VDELAAELGYAEGGLEVLDPDPSLGGEVGLWGVLNPEEESLVTTMRSSLERLAAAIGAPRSNGGLPAMVQSALDGVETVMRGELMRGNAERLPSLLPDLVFLVALSIVDQDEALRVSRRAAELIEQALRR
jgi:hypothetical protein